jgi:cytoskeletal protein CcmA (bactofilin family)
MLGKKEKFSEPSGVLNVLSEGTTIDGNLVSNGDLRIDGKVNGDVITQGKCVLGASGVIVGNIQAKSCDISGNVRGNLKVTETLFLKASGVITGDINTSKIVVEIGGQFNGACVMGNSVSINSETEKGAKAVTA